MDKNFYAKYFEVERNHWLMVGRREIVKDAIRRSVSAAPQEVTILDFGCGSGFLVRELAEQGYRSYGLDMSEEAIAFGLVQGTERIAVLNGSHVPFSDGTFDLILALDVLEHLENEMWALQEFERVLKPGGTIIITVPAYMFLWGVQDRISRHYRRYTKRNLLQTIEQSCTLNVIRTTYFNTLLFLPIALIRILSKMSIFRDRKSDFDINNKFLNSLFSFIFTIERKILVYMGFPFGVSILTVLTKLAHA